MSDDDAPAIPALMQVDLAKLPIWSGELKKDGYTCEQWVERVNRAQTTAGWTPQQTMAYVYNALRGSALLWYEALPRYGVDDKDWNVVRTELLDAYSRVQTTRTAVIGLSNLNQGADEPVNDFGARVAKVINDLDRLMPAAARQPAGVVWPAGFTALAGFNALAAATKQDVLNDAANKAVWNTMNHMGVQLFISNLKPVFRDELMKNPPATLMEAVKAARHLEKIKQDPKSTAAVSVITANDAADDFDPQIEALSTSFKSWLQNKRGASRGRGRGRGNNNNNRGSGRGNNNSQRNDNGSNSYNTCRYCKKPGHLQKVCNSRIRAGAPEVDQKGKPYAKYVNEVDEDNQTDNEHQEQGSIQAFNPWAYYEQGHLNNPDFC